MTDQPEGFPPDPGEWTADQEMRNSALMASVRVTSAKAQVLAERVALDGAGRAVVMDSDNQIMLRAERYYAWMRDGTRF